jgi:hypothetical protein
MFGLKRSLPELSGSTCLQVGAIDCLAVIVGRHVQSVPVDLGPLNPLERHVEHQLTREAPVSKVIDVDCIA